MHRDPPVRVLIAEDDPAQLDAIATAVLQLKPQWSVVARVHEADALLPAIEATAPDLLILDIHLGPSREPDWMARLPPELAVIFATCDPGFAVQAFEQSAVDYLLKPITLRRLRQALERASRDARLGSAAASAEAVDPAHRWITMSRGQDMVMVTEDEVAYLQADLKYTRVVTLRGEGLVRLGIGELCARLSPHDFVRIHRSVVVNRRHIAAVRRNELGQLEVHLDGRPEVLRVSRNHLQAFRAL